MIARRSFLRSMLAACVAPQVLASLLADRQRWVFHSKDYAFDGKRHLWHAQRDFITDKWQVCRFEVRFDDQPLIFDPAIFA
jgi:hypothetical protein